MTAHRSGSSHLGDGRPKALLKPGMGRHLAGFSRMPCAVRLDSMASRSSGVLVRPSVPRGPPRPGAGDRTQFVAFGQGSCTARQMLPLTLFVVEGFQDGEGSEVAQVAARASDVEVAGGSDLFTAAVGSQ